LDDRAIGRDHEEQDARAKDSVRVENRVRVEDRVRVQDPDGVGSLLAVDVGLRTGLALYHRDGRLLRYRSQNFGTARRLRRGARRLLAETPGLLRLVLEGGGSLGEIWSSEALRRDLPVRRVSAEEWREGLLLPRERRSGARAKDSAGDLARTVIDWSGAARPTSLRHDAAEAILIGLWGVLDAGWLVGLPWELRR